MQVIVRRRIAEEFENHPLGPILLSLRLTSCEEEVPLNPGLLTREG